MIMLLTRNLWRKLRGMSAFTTVIVRISKTKTKRLTAGKNSARNLIYLVSISSWIFFDVSFDFEADVVTLRLKKEINISSSMSAMLFALIFPRAQHASTFDISAERNAWLQSALPLFAIIWKQFSLRSLVIRDRLRSYGNQPLEQKINEYKSFR